MGKLTLDRQRNKKNKKRGGERGSATFEDEFRINGGGLGESGTFSYGYASRPGRRFWPIMEDFYRIDDGVEGGKVVGLFGVFDGHDGAGAAKYVKKNLFDNLLDHPKFISDTKSAIADAYSTTDSEFLNNKAEDISGSTALTAVLVGDCLLVANVGDSRAVICRAGKAVAVSRDHKPDQPDELQRIEDAGGEVTSGRVENRLAVSRSFGHRELKEFVIADPEIHEEEVDDTLEFLILASDGIWDVLTNDEAVSMVVPIQDPKEAAERLMEEAFLRRSLDNISVIVVRFLAPSNKNASTSLLFIISFLSIIIILFLLLFLLS